MIEGILNILYIKRWKYNGFNGKTRRYLAAAASSYGFFAISATYCWVTPMLAVLSSDKSPMPCTPYEASGLGILAELGMTLLAIPVADMANRYGRKPLLISTGPITTITWIIIYFTNDINTLLAMRFIQGVMLGIHMGVLPIYITEIASPSERGSMTSLASIFWNLGFLYSNAIVPFTPYKLNVFLTALPIAIYPFILKWFKDTPYFYIYRGLEEEARDSLSFFRNGNVEEELQCIKSQVETEKMEKASWKDLFLTKKGRNGLCVQFIVNSIMAVLFTQITYISKISQDLHKELYSTYAPAIVFGFAFVVISCFGNNIVDSIGRKPVIIVPTSINSLTLFIVSTYCLAIKFNPSISQFWYIPLISVNLGLLVMAFGVPSACRLYQSELFSTSARSFACALSIIDLSLKSSVFFYLFEIAEVHDKLYLIFFFYSVLTLFCAVHTSIYAPETKGKTFQEIQNML